MLEYILTLDFVEVDQDEFLLTEEHVQILDERRKKHLSGESKSYSWDEVINALGKKE